MFALYTSISSQLDEITTRGNWQTKKHSPLLPNYCRMLPSTITYSQREAGVFPEMTNGWMGGRTDEQAGGRGGWLGG